MLLPSPEAGMACPLSAFHSSYMVFSVLGSGSSGRVYEVAPRDEARGSSERTLAIKVCDLRHCSQEKVQEEYSILQSLLGKSHCIQIAEAYFEHPYSYLVFEKCSRLMMLSIGARKVVSELTLAFFFSQCFKALNAIHALEIVHGDVRLDNFMVVDNADKVDQVRLIDFGSAAVVSAPRTSSKCAPDLPITKGTSDGSFRQPAESKVASCWQPRACSVDMGDLGACLYALMFGQLPCSGTDGSEQELTFRFHERVASRLPANASNSCRAENLLRMVLERDVRKRCTAKAALSHPWTCAALGLSSSEVDTLTRVDMPAVNLLMTIQCAAENKVFGAGRTAPASDNDWAMDRDMRKLSSAWKPPSTTVASPRSSTLPPQSGDSSTRNSLPSMQ
jgi:serine/threonine protein kinase